MHPPAVPAVPAAAVPTRGARVARRGGPVLTLAAALAVALSLAGCRTAPAPGSTLATVFRPEKLAAIDAAIGQAISSNRCPGGVFWLERRGVVYAKAYGRRSVEPSQEPASVDTVYDAASLTKVLATAPAVALLIEQGRVDPDRPLAHYLPAFGTRGKEAITVRQVLTHTSGLRPGLGGGS